MSAMSSRMRSASVSALGTTAPSAKFTTTRLMGAEMVEAEAVAEGELLVVAPLGRGVTEGVGVLVEEGRLEALSEG